MQKDPSEKRTGPARGASNTLELFQVYVRIPVDSDSPAATERCTDRRTDRRMNRRTDRRTNRRTDRGYGRRRRLRKGSATATAEGEAS